MKPMKRLYYITLIILIPFISGCGGNNAYSPMTFRNDFEETVFKKHPLISKIKNTLYEQGAEYACMSGSGSTVLGLFDSAVALHDIGAPVIWEGFLP